MSSRPDDRSAAAAFPSTCWSRLLGKSGASPHGADLELLAQAYWRPVYGYVRVKWGLSSDAALDRTQDFFVWMLERDFAALAEPGRGRFRAFVKTALSNYLVDRAREDRAQKRGGDRLRLSLSGADEPVELPDVGSKTPDQVLDAEWRRHLVMRALDQIENEFVAEGRPIYFEVFRDYFIANHDHVDYAALGARYSISRDDVSNYLRKAKLRYRARLRQLVLETVDSVEDLEHELEWLFRGGS